VGAAATTASTVLGDVLLEPGKPFRPGEEPPLPPVALPRPAPPPAPPRTPAPPPPPPLPPGLGGPEGRPEPPFVPLPTAELAPPTPPGMPGSTGLAAPPSPPAFWAGVGLGAVWARAGPAGSVLSESIAASTVKIAYPGRIRQTLLRKRRTPAMGKSREKMRLCKKMTSLDEAFSLG
jgi:hypothetical protein